MTHQRIILQVINAPFSVDFCISCHLFFLTHIFVYSGFGEVPLGEGNPNSSVKTEEIADSFGKITVNASGQGIGSEMLDTSMAEGK
jgi:hypothetical protein